MTCEGTYQVSYALFFKQVKSLGFLPSYSLLPDQQKPRHRPLSKLHRLLCCTAASQTCHGSVPRWNQQDRRFVSNDIFYNSWRSLRIHLCWFVVQQISSKSATRSESADEISQMSPSPTFNQTNLGVFSRCQIWLNFIIVAFLIIAFAVYKFFDFADSGEVKF